MPIPDQLQNEALIAIVAIVFGLLWFLGQSLKMVLDRLTKSFAEEGDKQRSHDKDMMGRVLESGKEQARDIAESVKEGFKEAQVQQNAIATKLVDAMGALGEQVKESITENKTARQTFDEKMESLKTIPVLQERLGHLEGKVENGMEEIKNTLEKILTELAKVTQEKQAIEEKIAKLEGEVKGLTEQAAKAITQLQTILDKQGN